MNESLQTGKGAGRSENDQLRFLPFVQSHGRTCQNFMKFQVVCDSSADLPEQYAQQSGVTVVPFYISMDDEHYFREGVDLSIPDFYQTMIDHGDCFPKTSMPTIQDYMDAFAPHVQAGMPVLCICLTKQFSGSIQAAMNAKMTLEEDNPDAKIYVMDSQLVTALEGLFVKEAVRLRDLDLSLEEAVPLLEEIRGTGRIFFTTKDLKYLEHGGRLSKAASVAGSMLNLKPILCFHGGDLDSPEICRGRKKSLKKVVDNFFSYLEENHMDLHGYQFGTGIGVDIPEYPDFVAMLEERFRESGVQPDEWFKVQIGATIGVHTGPYPMGLGILKKCEI